ncbi:putative membrane protein [Streptomyces davaonensis JCM 4913]|uniref:Putative membrane protein n=1 Tax=Streptomyces davaonensis (strain DSM 101723 / JCM 4913 / KCC S-0913 / 768) TaxID=1214101 RepID=K4QSU7_STRDJ|nr:hypothetical protein [Streptomyces davaonensis]CCK25271.1 putative membrane protein [Streptomyces davaonensis JCM 4913]
MTTRSSTPTSQDPDIPSAPPEPVGQDPVGGLLHAAVADRPVEEVAQLITLLERSPEHARATLEALRAVGVDRSVEDVTHLVGLLTRPPRTADSADETIRAAAERRSLEDVTRLVALLHRTDLEPHCGQEAVRAAATGRPVEELVELIRRLTEERERPPLPEPPPEPPVAGLAPRSLTPGQPPRPPTWPGRLTVAALVVCAVACFPLGRDGSSLRVYALALGMSVACLAVALLLTLRITAPVLAGAVLVPAALAAAQLLDGRLPSTGLSRALDLTLAPAWAAGPAAVCASLAALTALLVHLTAPGQSRKAQAAQPERREPAVVGSAPE